MKVQFKKLREVPTPIYASEGAAALDLYAAADGVYNTYGNYYEYDTGVAVKIPEEFGGLVLPRSSISNKRMMLANSVGLIDLDFRSSIKARFTPPILFGNEIVEDFLYKKGDRIAQLLIVPCPRITLVEVDELDQTERGEGGFGSTDKIHNSPATGIDCVFKPGDRVRVIGNGDGKDQVTHFYDLGEEVTFLYKDSDGWANCESQDGNQQILELHHIQLI